MTLTYETILVNNEQGIVRITLNRPNKRNAISMQMHAEIVDAVEVAARDPQAGAVVIRGAGSDFCSGYDLSEKGKNHHIAEATSTARRALATAELSRLWSRLWDAPIATIAQVHGHCIAGGTDLALSCDLILVAEDAVLGFPALRMGGVPPVSAWLYNIGPQWTKRLLLTGDTFTGRMAQKIGFALEAVQSEELEDRTEFIARRIALMGRDIAGINKYAINRGIELMGRGVMMNVAAPLDTLGNMAAEMTTFMNRAREIGPADAFKERDAPFADGIPIDVSDRR